MTFFTRILARGHIDLRGKLIIRKYKFKQNLIIDNELRKIA